MKNRGFWALKKVHLCNFCAILRECVCFEKGDLLPFDAIPGIHSGNAIFYRLTRIRSRNIQPPPPGPRKDNIYGEEGRIDP